MFPLPKHDWPSKAVDMRELSGKRPFGPSGDHLNCRYVMGVER
jgi:hypothetical protein